MRRLQARLDQHIDGEGAVVGAQRFVSGQAGQFKDFVGFMRRLWRLGIRRWRCARRLWLDTVQWRQLNRLRLHSVRRMIAVDRVAIGIGVLVDLRSGGKRSAAECRERCDP